MNITNDQRGITGLETAIVLIAFVVVAAVFAFTVLTTGLFTSQETEKASRAAIATTESSLVKLGSVVAGGPCLEGNNCVGDANGVIDWTGCSSYERRGEIFPVDDGLCAAHAQLFRFKLTPAGDKSIPFNPEGVQIWWYDTGSGRGAADRPVAALLPLNSTNSVAQGEQAAQGVRGNSAWSYRWEEGQNDLELDPGEAVEILIGATSTPLHPVEKNTDITIEVIPQDGSVVLINAKMPPVIKQVMDISP